MKVPIFVRDCTAAEQAALEQARRSKDSFVVRRAQILRLSAQRKLAHQIAASLGCTAQTVRNVIHAFNRRGLACLHQQTMGPKQPVRIFDGPTRARLLEIAHTSPREFGKPRSTWTLELLAEVAVEQGLTQEQVSHETIRQAIQALGASWQRAKHWITSPDPLYEVKKSNGIG
ncbi:MAG TPA: helix-turn-helix domain-containing protein [Gammaproteobacteria bacterium]|jgi:transposase|nr:helix-turn-helix domain-containing protein [Gammaproteobacteria bacterium]